LGRGWETRKLGGWEAGKLMTRIFTARFARGAENTKMFNLSIAVERTAMESNSVPALCSGTEGGNAS